MSVAAMIADYQQKCTQLRVAIGMSDDIAIRAIDREISRLFHDILEFVPADYDDTVSQATFFLEYMRPSAEDTELSKQIRTKLLDAIAARPD